MKYGIRSDLHGRIDLANRHLIQLHLREYDGILDLGDIEATFIDPNHPLRAGQTNAEETMDAIIRNAIVDGQVTEVGEQAVAQTLESVAAMQKHEEEIMQFGFYRGISGNGTEGWTKMFKAFAPVEAQEQLKVLLDRYALMRESKSEIVNGTGFIYLPWKASMESVNQALEVIEAVDPQNIVVLSHDYLTKGSIPSESKSGIRKMQNEEQIVTTLDRATKVGEVVGYFGHIGWEYAPFKETFMHGRKMVTTYHTDEKNGKLLELEV